MRTTRTATTALAAALLVGTLAAGPAGAATVWTTYHGDNARSGVDASEPNLNPLHPAWANALDGASVFGQPVEAAGRVFVATEDDNVYALSAHDGHVLWRHNIGRPLTNVGQNAGCGDIDPLGITSTPVIDLGRNTVYVVGELSNGAPSPQVTHRLVGFNMSTGSITRSVDADPMLPAGENPVHLQQRAALAVANGRVYVAYGGLAGDCGTYHGWVVGVDESGARPSVQFNVTPNSFGGAIWMGGGGPSVDAAGNVYVTTGNTNSPGGPAPLAEAVVKLSPSLGLLASFQDKTAVDDQDLGTGDATFVGGGNLFAVGKTHIGYLLQQSNLHQVAPISGTVCGSDPDGGAAYDQATDSVYIPCRGGGIQQVNLKTLHTGWRSESPNGAPILVDGKLWAADYNGARLQELDATNGNVLQTVGTGGLPHFASPSAADDLLLIDTNNGVQAFAGPSGPPPPPAPPTAGYWLGAADGGVFGFGTAGFHGSLGAIHLNAPIVAMAATPSKQGYWLVGSDGGVFTFGDARFHRSTGAIRLNQPIVGIAPTTNGQGYWLLARDGGVFSFGNARFHGSLGAIHLNAPIVTGAATPSGLGYWLVGSDGGVFTFGDARFHGSTGAIRLNQPIVGMAPTPNGQGYWLVARDGGIFTFGDAAFHGSLGAIHLNAPIIAMARTRSGNGYWLVGSDGGVFTFGGAAFEGSLGGVQLNAPIDAAAAGP